MFIRAHIALASTDFCGLEAKDGYKKRASG